MTCILLLSNGRINLWRVNNDSIISLIIVINNAFFKGSPKSKEKLVVKPKTSPDIPLKNPEHIKKKKKKNRWTGCLGNFTTLIIFSFFFPVSFWIETFFAISFTPLFVRLSYYYNAFIKNYSFVFSVLVFFLCIMWRNQKLSDSTFFSFCRRDCIISFVFFMLPSLFLT